MRGEDRRDADAPEKIVGLGGVDSGFAEAAEGSAQVAALRGGVLVELDGQAAALAVVGLGEIDELEIESERARELVGGGEFQRANPLERLLEVRGGGLGVILRIGFAAGNGGAAKGFYGVVERIAGLLAQDASQQGAKGADIAS